jgi:hypothetical protein
MFPFRLLMNPVVVKVKNGHVIEAYLDDPISEFINKSTDIQRSSNGLTYLFISDNGKLILRAGGTGRTILYLLALILAGALVGYIIYQKKNKKKHLTPKETRK